MTGRLAFGPNQLDDTPGRPLIVSASVPARRNTSSSPLSVETGAGEVLLRKGLPVTTTSGNTPAPGAVGAAGVGCAWACARCDTAENAEKRAMPSALRWNEKFDFMEAFARGLVMEPVVRSRIARCGARGGYVARRRGVRASQHAGA